MAVPGHKAPGDAPEGVVDAGQRDFVAQREAQRRAEEDDRDLVKKLKDVFARAKRRRMLWEPHWQEVYDYVFPYRENFTGSTEGERKTDFVFDQTAVEGVPRFASRIQHGLFPPASHAFNLAPGTYFDRDRITRDVLAELEHITDLFHEGLRNSNFESELHEGCQDLGIGTMTLRCDPGTYPGELEFTCVSPNSLYLLPGGHDRVGTWVYEHKGKTLEEVRASWPKARYGARMEQAMRTNPQQKVSVLVMTITDPNATLEYKCNDYLFCPDFDQVMHRQTFTGVGSCPWITARWSKTGSEVWGRGPILTVLPSVKTVNLVVEMVLQNAQMAISGMYAYDDDGVFNPDSIRVQPGLFVPRAPGSKVEALQSPSRFDVSQLILADERTNIRKGLFIDELEKIGRTPYSAEEISQRMADTARNMGSVSGRLWNEFVRPLAERMSYIYRKQGIVDLPELDGKELRMVPLSPLLRIQDQSDVSNFIQYVQVMNGTMGQGTSSMVLNRKRTVDWLNRKFRIPDGIVNSEYELKQALAGVAGGMEQMSQQDPELMKTAVGAGLKLLQ